ncbi:hypothetical protein K1719_004102 [Acacia pycnantha]|nr:hypothetical protein K1719_004102 [Acacia pycnantha]
MYVCFNASKVGWNEEISTLRQWGECYAHVRHAKGTSQCGHNKSSCKEPPSREEQLKAATARQTNNTLNSQQPTSQATQQQCGSDSLNSQQPPQPTQEETTSQSSGPAASHAQPSTRRTSTRRARGGVSGFGIRFDETTGRSVYNPGLNSEFVIEEGTSNDYMRRNEREMRLSGGNNSKEPTGS